MNKYYYEVHMNIQVNIITFMMNSISQYIKQYEKIKYKQNIKPPIKKK